MMSDGLEHEIVLRAIGAAGPINGDVRGWQTRVAEYTGLVASMLRPPLQGKEDEATTPLVTARKVINSAVFKAEFVGWEDDINRRTGVKTHRLVVKFKSDTQNDNETEDDGTEHLRTEPNWTRAGWVMQKLVKSLTPGQQCSVFKHMEGFDGHDERGKPMKKNVRVLAHLELLGRPPQSRSDSGEQGERPATERPPSSPDTDRQAQPPLTPAAATRGAGSSPPSDPAPDSHGPHYEAVQARLESLTARQRVAWAALCRGKGVNEFMDPSTDDVDKVMLAFSELEKGAS